MAKKNKQTGKPSAEKEEQMKKQAQLEARRAKEKAEAEKKRRRKKTILITAGCVGGAAVIAGAFFGIRYLKQNSGGLQKIVAETEHYQVTAAMFACYFRQCEDSYLSFAAENESLAKFDENKSLKEQEYQEGQTWYDMFFENTMNTVQTNLKLCEQAYDNGYALDAEALEQCRTSAESADLSNYRKGVRAEDYEKAMQITLLAQNYQTDAQSNRTVTDEEVAAYYQEHAADYLSVSLMGYSFTWNPEGIINGELAEHDAALKAAQALSEAETQQDFTDYVFHYLTDEKEIARDEAEQMAGDLIITKSVSDFPEDVQNWIHGGAKRNETLLLPREDACCATVYMLRDTPTADDSKTVDFRVIFMSAAEYDGVDQAAEFAKKLQKEVEDAENSSEAFAERASEYSQDTATYANGGLVSGYSAVRTTYGEELSAWAFDRDRKHGDMTIIERSSAVILAYFEGTNDHSGWENEVREDMLVKAEEDFQAQCDAHNVTLHEENYEFILD